MKSVVSYPERGTGGRNTYRGNFSPKFVEDILNFFKPESVGDYTVGSGTTLDVCKAYNIPCIGTDLNPAHSGVNLLKDDLPPVDMGGYSKMPTLIILHPPYPQKMVLYSGSQWGTKPHPDDPSHYEDYQEFIKTINRMHYHAFLALPKGGRLITLVGDAKKKGQLYSMVKDMAFFGTLEQIVVKAQHNCLSDSRQYSGKFIPIVHEYAVIMRKDSCRYETRVISVAYTTFDSRKYQNLTWRQAVRSALRNLGGKAELPELYKELENFVTTKKHSNPQAKIRETLQTSSEFKPVARGVWALQEVA
jgi:hypothetical protein